MVVKIKEYFEKTRNIKNNDKSKKFVLRGQKNVRYHEKILSNKKKFQFSLKNIKNTELKISTYTNISTSYSKIYDTLL